MADKTEYFPEGEREKAPRIGLERASARAREALLE